MLIDDEMEHLLPLADLLRQSGIVPTIATSDEEALFDIRMSRPDLVVLDAKMAHRGLLVAIRAHVPTLPLVLMISDPTDDPNIAAMLEIADVTCVEKPVHAWRLLELLSDARHIPATTSRA